MAVVEAVDEGRITRLLASGDLRAAADLLAPGAPRRAADLYETLLDHGRVADCLAQVGDGVGAVAAALKANDSMRVEAIHARLLCGALPGLDGVAVLYERHSRPDLAADAVQALGRSREAARFAEADGDGVRAGELWLLGGDVEAAIAAFESSLPVSALALGRLHLRLDQPRQAIAALAQAADKEAAASLLALTYLRLGLTEAAREVLPGLGDLVVARSKLERELDAVADPSFLGTVRIDGPELGGEGVSFVGELGPEPCLVRILPTDEAVAYTLAAFDPPMPGTPRLLRYVEGSRRLIVTRRGQHFSAWARGGPPTSAAVRVLQSAARTLMAAHQRGLVHAKLQMDDIRVLPGALATLDGWHRAWSATSAVTQAADAIELLAPEVQLGREATPASDVFSIARLAEAVFEDVDAGAFTDGDPTRRPGMDAVAAWLGRLKPAGLRAVDHSQPVVAATPTQRYEPVDAVAGTFRDVLLNRRVRLVPASSQVPPQDLLSWTDHAGEPRLVVRSDP